MEGAVTEGAAQSALVTFLVNGAIGLLLALVLIKVFARVFAKAADVMIGTIKTSSDAQVKSMDAQTVVLKELQTTVYTTGQQNVKATGLLTERISRIEGKIEGIALHERGMSDIDLTPVDGVERSTFETETPTPLLSTRAAGARARTVPGQAKQTPTPAPAPAPYGPHMKRPIR